jgi:hypothetical protein
MLSLSNLVQLWKNNRFIPGGQSVGNALPSDDTAKRERLTKLYHDHTIVRDIRDGIAILGHAIDGLEKTQEFNRDPSAFKGNTRGILVNDDFLMVAHVLRLIFPEGMISELRPRKRGRDEVNDDDDDDNDNDNNNEGGLRKHRVFLTPKGPRPKQGYYTVQQDKPVPPSGGLFKSTKPVPLSGGLFGSPRPAPPNGGLFKSTKPVPPSGGLFGSPGPVRPSGGLFKSTKPAPPSGGLFGSPGPAPPNGGLFKLEKPLSTGGLSSVKTNFSGFGSSETVLSTVGLNNNKELETYKQAQLPTGPSLSEEQQQAGNNIFNFLFLRVLS